MAKQPVIQTVTEGSNAIQSINTNFGNIKEKFLELLSRTGATPNNMEADLDMDDNDILNVREADFQEIYYRGVELYKLLGLRADIDDLLLNYVTDAQLQAALDALFTDYQTEFDLRYLRLTGGTVIGDVNVIGNSDTTGLATFGDDVEITGDLSVTGSASASSFDAPRTTSNIVDLPSVSGSITIDLALGSVFKISLAGNTTLSFTNPPDLGRASVFVLDIENLSTYSVTWPAAFNFEEGVAPAAPTPGSRNLYTVLVYGAGLKYFLVETALEVSNV